MKLRITATILQEMSPAIEDARGGKYPQETDSMYFKVDDAFNAAPAKAKAVVIDFTEREVAEIQDRIDYYRETCQENLADTYDRADRMFWLGQKRAAVALLDQIKAGGI